MKIIKLTKDKECVVDDEDYDYLNQFKWYTLVTKDKYSGREKFYALRKVSRKNLLMHRDIMKCPTGYVVDHGDGNTLNNQKNNLRICTYSQNLQNQKSYKLKYKGVYTENKKEKIFFKSSIYVKGKSISLGCFKTPETAAYAYNKAAEFYFKEYAYINKLDIDLIDYNDYNENRSKRIREIIPDSFSVIFFSPLGTHYLSIIAPLASIPKFLKITPVSSISLK